MINSIKAYKLVAHTAFVLMLSISNIAFAADPNPTSATEQTKAALFNSMEELNKTSQSATVDPVKEATTAAAQFKSMANTIAANRRDLASSSASQSIFNVSIIAKLKGIINAIELQRKYLVELVVGKTSSSPSDSSRLNSILTSLDAQRKSLSNFFAPKSETTTHLSVNPYPSPANKTKEKALQVFVAH